MPADRDPTACTTPATRSRRSWSCTTRPPPGSPRRSRAVRRAIDRTASSRLAAGRHDFLARFDRLSPRRMGRRRHRRRFAEGPDAAAGPVLQCDQQQGAGRSATPGCPEPTGTGRRCCRNPNGFFPYTPTTNLLYGLRKPSTCCRKKVCQTSSRVTTATPKRRGVPPGMGPGDPCESGRTQHNVDRPIMPEGHSADALRTIILDNST